MKENSYHVRLESPIPNSFRTKMACDSLDIDIAKKSVHELNIQNIELPKDWSIGIILGASGSGKTTLAKHIFGDDCFELDVDETLPIIDSLPSELSYEECATMLSGIGLTSVPCWVRPMYTLSNGQKARAEAVLQMCKDKISVIDEWTSVVDRQVGKIMSHCLQKYARKNKKQIVICSCHYDIVEWLSPDWVIDCNDQVFRGHQKKNEKNFGSTFDPLERSLGNILASIII